MQKDKQIQADKSLFCALFPEQTKTPTRIVVWSLILLADLVLLAAGAMHLTRNIKFRKKRSYC